MRTKFELNEVEKKRAEKFIKKHLHPETNHGAIGGHISYTFIPTGIGNAVTIKCGDCDKEENITDYDCW